MFLAGLELDLGVFARYRTQAIGFTALTFIAPLVLGTVGGLLVGYDLAASILVGYTFGVLPPVARWFFRTIGTARTLRYAFVLDRAAVRRRARRGRRHRGHRRCVLRRPGAQPPRAERGRVHGAHRVLRLGAASSRAS
jgi:hypothetical protein